MKFFTKIYSRIRRLSKVAIAAILAATLALSILLPVTIIKTVKSIGENRAAQSQTAEKVATYKKSCVSKISEKDYEGALADINKAIELDDDDASFYLLRGAVNTYLEEYSSAVTDYVKALDLNPKYTEVHQSLAFLYYQLGQKDTALVECKSALNHDEGNIQVLQIRMTIYAEQKDYTNALADAQQISKLQPKDANSYAAVGDYQVNLKQYTEAIASYTKALKYDADNLKVLQVRMALYAEQKDYTNALTDALQISKLQPKDANSYAAVGDYQVYLKQYAQAVASYTSALTYDQDNIKVLQMRMSVYGEQKEYAKALADAQQISKLQPENANSYAAVGDYQVNLQKYTDAVSSYTKALKYADAADEKDLINAVTLQRATCYFDLEKYALAITDYTAYFKANTSVSNNWIYLAQSYYNVSDMKNAKIWYEKCLKAKIKPEMCNYYLAGVSYSEKDYTKAVAYYTACVDANYSKDYSMYNRGVSYLSLKEYQKARADFLEASEITTDSDLKAQATSAYKKTPNIQIITSGSSDSAGSTTE